MRASGILLHISSLPSKYASGNLGLDAYKFVDFLYKSRQTLWQILPFNIPHASGSPYSARSSFGGNPDFISPELLVKDGLLTKEDFRKYDGDHTKLLLKAKERFSFEHPEFLAFFSFNENWLKDLALFQVLSKHFPTVWSEWPEDYKNRNQDHLDIFLKEHKDEIYFEYFCQFQFEKQWALLKKYAQKKSVTIIGDVPIFVAYHSMEVWRWPHYFKLGPNKEMIIETGAPPDDFSHHGQKWGNPNYDWEQLKKNSFKFWVDRLNYLLTKVDLVRLDHFLGFINVWEIPVSDPDASTGTWAKTPGKELFDVLKRAIPHMPFIAEDLGHITEEVRDLRKDLNIPSMKVMQFAFGSDHLNEHHPEAVEKETIYYTGTHDNNTIVGFFQTSPSEVKERIFKCFKKNHSEKNIHQSFLYSLFYSKADQVIFPIQDLLGQGESQRMNIPGTVENNWKYSFNWKDLTSHEIKFLKYLSYNSSRNIKKRSPLFSKKFPWKFMLPGLVTFFLFMILPIISTFLIGFTNLGTGHLLSQNEVYNLFLQEKYVPENSETHSFELFQDGNSYEILLENKYGARFDLSDSKKIVPLSPSEGNSNFKKLSLGEVFKIRDQLKKISFQNEDGTSLRYFRTNLLLNLKQKFLPRTGQKLYDEKNDEFYIPNTLEGFYESSDQKKRLYPGFTVFIGSKNFTSLLTDPKIGGIFLKILSWTFIWAIGSVFLTFSAGLFFALLLNRKKLKFKAFYRVLFIIPYSIPFFISVLVMRGLLNEDFGAINEILSHFGISNIPWLSDPFWAKASCLMVNLWLGFPYMLLVITGILQSIPSTLYEAAILDGASRWATLRYITFPLIMSAIVPLLIGTFAFNLNNFVGIYLLTAGGPPIIGATTPAGETDILLSYTYRLAFEGGQGQNFGLASAIAIFIFIMICFITLINFKFSGMMKEQGKR